MKKKITTFHQFVCKPKETDATARQETMRFNVVCNTEQARHIWRAVEAVGWDCDSINQGNAMSIDDVPQQLGLLKVLGRVMAPSPFDAFGNWTPEAIEAAKLGEVRLYGADGKPFDFDK